MSMKHVNSFHKGTPPAPEVCKPTLEAFTEGNLERECAAGKKDASSFPNLIREPLNHERKKANAPDL